MRRNCFWHCGTTPAHRRASASTISGQTRRPSAAAPTIAARMHDDKRRYNGCIRHRMGDSCMVRAGRNRAGTSKGRNGVRPSLFRCGLAFLVVQKCRNPEVLISGYWTYGFGKHGMQWRSVREDVSTSRSGASRYTGAFLLNRWQGFWYTPCKI